MMDNRDTKQQILDSSKLKDFTDDKQQKVLQKVGIHCGKKKNCLLRAIPPIAYSNFKTCTADM